MEQEKNNGILNHLPAERILAEYASAPGNEIASGKFVSKESSAALAANTFGLFLDHPGDLPRLPGTEECGWPAGRVGLEKVVRFPWRGGLHPCLDALIETGTALIGVESKRFEPFRPKQLGEFSDAYMRPKWGDAMRGYESIRDLYRQNASPFTMLDAAQLVKHAFGLRSEAERRHRAGNPRVPILYYLYAEPASWPVGGKVIGPEIHEAHRQEIQLFAKLVAGDEVEFHSCSYSRLLAAWSSSSSPDIRDHAAAIVGHFKP
ncbi:hypothetical protein [Emcibacter sp. SYSU 3D8]|uniref:hypothetical protein n=1 Tax=Emcibacter sp. SYSU 3D8 TaxID=3133969 RepID=UPI0031FE51E2